MIARYGNSWRGIKPKIAAEHGAIGCIIYSDPRDDGYFQDDVFPDGPMRNENGVQRGSVMDMPIYPGDPTTPGVGSKGDVKRLRAQRHHHAHQNSHAADFLWRRQAASRRAERPRGAGKFSRRASAHLSRWSRPGKSPPESRIQLGHQARV